MGVGSESRTVCPSPTTYKVLTYNNMRTVSPFLPTIELHIDLLDEFRMLSSVFEKSAQSFSTNLLLPRLPRRSTSGTTISSVDFFVFRDSLVGVQSGGRPRPRSLSLDPETLGIVNPLYLRKRLWLWVDFHFPRDNY